MARQYPRFLFSNPKNTKSEGPFVVHTFFPKCIMKIISVDAEGFPEINILEMWEQELDLLPMHYTELRISCEHWFRGQIKSGRIKI